MRITRVYTKVGDRGTTRLVGGDEVPKDDVRIEAYGTVDELNAIIGLVRSADRGEGHDRLEATLTAVQHDLFDVGAELATPEPHRWKGMYRIGDADVTRLERWIDTFNADLPPLREFVLPGGGTSTAALHQARTVCRRAERRVTSLCHADASALDCMKYLNRLSDLLFVLSRWVALARSEAETLWDRDPAHRKESPSAATDVPNASS